MRALFAGALIVLVSYASARLPSGAPDWGVWAMIIGAALTLASAMFVGAINSRVSRSRAIAAAVFLFCVIAAGFGVPRLLPAETATSSLVLGLPLRAAIEIFGVGLLPLWVLRCFSMPPSFVARVSTMRRSRSCVPQLRGAAANVSRPAVLALRRPARFRPRRLPKSLSWRRSTSPSVPRSRPGRHAALEPRMISSSQGRG